MTKLLQKAATPQKSRPIGSKIILCDDVAQDDGSQHRVCNYPAVSQLRKRLG